MLSIKTDSQNIKFFHFIVFVSVESEIFKDTIGDTEKTETIEQKQNLQLRMPIYMTEPLIRTNHAHYSPRSEFLNSKNKF